MGSTITWKSVVTFSAFCFGMMSVSSTSFTYPSAGTDTKGQNVQLDVPYVPTPDEVVERMLALAEVKKGETVYDLGSGDGRIVIAAAKKHQARGIGVDLDPQRVKEAKANVKENNVEKLVEIREGDALKTDVSDADVITLYLLPSVNLKLKPTLQQLEPGTRIVSHDFDMGTWKPVKEETVTVSGRDHNVYLWIVGQGDDTETEASATPTKTE